MGRAKLKTDEAAIEPAERQEAAERIRQALVRAKDGDPEPLQAVFEDFPHLVALFGDASRHVEDGLVAWYARDDGAVRQSVRAHLADMRKGLRRDGATALEKLLVDRVVVTWLRVQQAELIKTDKDKEGVTLAWATVWERRVELAHRNYLSACKALATVRRLLKPRIAQVNIGAQQVNVAQSEGNAANVTGAGPAAATAADATRSLPRVVVQDTEGDNQDGQ